MRDTMDDMGRPTRSRVESNRNGLNNSDHIVLANCILGLEADQLAAELSQNSSSGFIASEPPAGARDDLHYPNPTTAPCRRIADLQDTESTYLQDTERDGDSLEEDLASTVVEGTVCSIREQEKTALSSTTSSPAISPVTFSGQVIRGKTFESISKQAERMAAEAEEKERDRACSDGQERDEKSGRAEEALQIPEVSSFRQLKPYRDLAQAGNDFIERRRQLLLQSRAMGSSNGNLSVSLHDSTGSNEMDLSVQKDGIASKDNPGEERSDLEAVLGQVSSEEFMSTTDVDAKVAPAVRLSKRQQALAAKGKLPSHIPSMMDSPADDGKATGTLRSLRGAPRKAGKMAGIGNRNYSDQFPVKLHHLLDNADPDIVGWRPHGRAFRVNEPKQFVEDVLPLYGFKQSKITSFYRQLNLYGFSRIIKGPDSGSYYHECFLRGRPYLIKGMVRVKIKGGGQRPKPKDIAKTEPNFYEMPPIDDSYMPESTQTTEECNTSVELAREKPKRPKKKMRKKKKKKKAQAAKKQERNQGCISTSPPVPFEENVTHDLSEDMDGVVHETQEEEGIVPSSLAHSGAPTIHIMSNYGETPSKITPSPYPRDYVTSSSFSQQEQESFHEHIPPPPVYNECVPPSNSSSFTVYNQAVYTNTHMSAGESSYEGIKVDVKNQNYGSVKRDQRDIDADLLIEDWHNAQDPSKKECTYTPTPGKMWLPSSPITIDPSTKIGPAGKDEDYMTAIENTKNDSEFGEMLEELMDNL